MSSRSPNTRIRIVCKAPPSNGLMRFFPSTPDVRLLAIADDGTETDISASVRDVAWSVGVNRASEATVTFVGAELDAEAMVTP